MGAGGATEGGGATGGGRSHEAQHCGAELWGRVRGCPIGLHGWLWGRAMGQGMGLHMGLYGAAMGLDEHCG